MDYCEGEPAHMLGCKRLSYARRVLRGIRPAVELPDGPRWTEAYLGAILGECIPGYPAT
jgi:hypothetical protein